MAKDFSFPFYINDWLGGTMYFIFEEKGAYLELLLLQFNTGRIKITLVKQVLKDSYSRVWENIKDKFETDGEFYWNEKMESVKENRRAFVESRIQNRLGKTKQITSVNQVKKTRKTLVKLVESESDNISNNDTKEEKTDFEKKINQFYDFRKELKKPILDGSKESWLKKLNSLANGNENIAIEILEQSIANGWQGIFELKANTENKLKPRVYN